MKSLRQIYRLLRTYNCPHPVDVPSNFRLHNFGESPAVQDFWLLRFMQVHRLLNTKSVSVFSVFGLREMIALNRSEVKLFVARENLHRSNWVEYDDLCLREKSIDLSIGFDYIVNDDRYIRFPLWIMWLFPPDIDYNGVKAFCDRINNPQNSSYDNRKFCSFVTSHDDIGRKELFNEINAIDSIDSAGRFLHNCDDLKNLFNDDKLKFLRQYRFNLCPENSNYEGYCTEKIFEAISSGCVPIYWGSNNYPEPDVLNQNAICFVRIGERNEEGVIGQIRELNSNKEYYEAFARQPRLLPDAADIIMQQINNLEKKIKSVVN